MFSCGRQFVFSSTANVSNLRHFYLLQDPRQNNWVSCGSCTLCTKLRSNVNDRGLQQCDRCSGLSRSMSSVWRAAALEQSSTVRHPLTPQPTLHQLFSGHIADIPYLQTNSFPFPLDPPPNVGTRYPAGYSDGSWISEKAGHFNMMSAELCDAIASIPPDGEEDSLQQGFVGQESLPQPVPQGSLDLCQPASMTVFLKPLDPSEKSMAVSEAVACQVLCSLDNGQQVFHSEPPSYTHSSTEPQFHEDVPEFGTPFQKVNAMQTGDVAPSAAQGLYPVLPQSFLAPPTLPFVQPTTTVLVPPNSLSAGYSLMPRPCFPQLLQTAWPVYPENQMKMSSVRFPATYWDAKSRKPCSCAKSQCLKLYCDCFANGDVCSNCRCINCYNNPEHEPERHQAIKICLDRNPEAFWPKIGAGKRGNIGGRHNKGCNCKRSGCLKNYCECYEAKIMCSSICKCVSCRNYDGGQERPAVTSPSSMALPGSYATAQCQEGSYATAQCQEKCPLAGLTLRVVETTCVSLLAQAELAEKDGQTQAQAEKVILEEFGQCLTQVVQSILKWGSSQA